MINISPFRVTQESLENLDRKTREGLQALLDPLNVTLSQVVQAFAQLPASPPAVPVSLRTGGVVADSFPLLFRTEVSRPTFVAMTCTPKDPNHSHATPRVMQGFQLTDAGLVSIPFITGLLPNNTYQLAFLVR